MRPSIAHARKQLDPLLAASRHTTAPISHTRLLSDIFWPVRPPFVRPCSAEHYEPGPIFFGGGGPGPRPPTIRGPPTKPLNFWLTIDVSLVIVIEDFEINEN